MAAEGLRVVGRFDSAEGTQVQFLPTLAETLRFADAWFPERLQPLFDAFAERIGLSLPAGEFEQYPFEPPQVTRIDLAAEDISTVLWTSGYRPAFGWIEPPVLDDLGLPRTDHGITDVPGLAFIGTPWLVDMGSANLVGVARDAESLVSRLEHSR